MRLFFKLGAVVFGALMIAEACSQKPAAEALCDPGENIFCRCPGGDRGTKTCRADGQGFEPCVSRSGECPALGGTSSSSSTTTGGGSGDGGSGGDVSSSGGDGGGATGAAALYEPCVEGADCASGLCGMGYCLQRCTSFQDCLAPKGDCIRVQDVGFCLRTCDATFDCQNAYGDRSLCGFAEAIDDLPNTVCAYWDPEPRLPPEGSSCYQNQDCSLGNPHRQAVCAFETCVTGCYEDRDCPEGLFCSSQSALGSCQ